MSLNNNVGLALLFTKIEDSERLESLLEGMYNDILDKHHTIIKSLLQAYENQIIEATGDNSFISFNNPEEAVRAAVAFQQFIGHHAWPNDEQVSIRIGLHWGTVPSGDSFTNDDVLLTSSICNAAHGEQILLSREIVAKLKGKQVNDLTIHKLGDFLLHGFDDSMPLYQLDVPGNKVNFPLLKTVSASPSIAVLPFYNMNIDSRGDYLGLGMAEEVINFLDKKPGLQVLARATTFGVNPMLNIKELGNVLNASAVLDGTVMQEDKRIYITAELTDVQSGAEIWTKKFDGNDEEILAIPDEIAKMVFSSLVEEVMETSSHINNTPQTENIEAYEKYLRGNKFYYQFSLQSVQFARQMYQHAMQIDRSYALAYCGLADCFSYLFMHSDRSEENLTKAENFSKKAIKLNPGLAQAYSAYGVALSLKENFQESEQAFEKAIELDPMLFDAQYQYARMAFNRGDLLQAASHFEAASRIRQDDYQALLLNGQCYDSLGFAEKALQTRIEGVKIAEEVLLLNPGNVRALYMGANGLVALNDQKKGIKWLQRALLLEPDDPMLLYNAGCIYSLCNISLSKYLRFHIVLINHSLDNTQVNLVD
jgi:adenylate cyclase